MGLVHHVNVSWKELKVEGMVQPSEGWKDAM